MGKGKAKGWRPPAAGAAGSMLFGSADHITGDIVASPVQLREEGKTIPVGHMNYGDAWGDPASKASESRATSSPLAGSTTSPTAWKPSSTSKDGAQESLPEPTSKPSSIKSKAAAVAPPVPKFVETTAGGPGDGMTEIERRRAALKAQQKEDGMTEIERRRAALLEARGQAAGPDEGASRPQGDEPSSTEPDEARKTIAKTEIERRREAMMQREREQLQHALAEAPDAEAEDDGFESRRRAVEARRLDAQRVAREAEVRRKDAELATKLQAAFMPPPTEDVKHEASDGVEEAATKRLRLSTGGDEVKNEEPRSGAMQQGLQQWADRVNALAEGEDTLLKRCREHVRRRILRAHADGDLHTNNWEMEPLPTMSDLTESCS